MDQLHAKKCFCALLHKGNEIVAIVHCITGKFHERFFCVCEMATSCPEFIFVIIVFTRPQWDYTVIRFFVVEIFLCVKKAQKFSWIQLYCTT